MKSELPTGLNDSTGKWEDCTEEQLEELVLNGTYMQRKIARSYLTSLPERIKKVKVIPASSNLVKTPRTIQINAKCSDLFWARFSDSEKSINEEYSGYVPSWMPGEHCGDYVSLTIDIDTGRILNWKKPTQAQLNETF